MKELLIPSIALLIAGLFGVYVIGKVIAKIYRTFRKLTRQDAFDLVCGVLPVSKWEDFLELYAKNDPTPPGELTKEEIKRQREKFSQGGDGKKAEAYGLVAKDPYDPYGDWVVTELGKQYSEPISGSTGVFLKFHLSKLKDCDLENVRSTRYTVSATFILHFERTELADLLKAWTRLRRTFELKADRPDAGDWFLTELIEIGLLGSKPYPFPLMEFRNAQVYSNADREEKDQKKREKWKDEPDVEAALARYDAETDPEKKALLAEAWRTARKAARERLGIK